MPCVLYCRVVEERDCNCTVVISGHSGVCCENALDAPLLPQGLGLDLCGLEFFSVHLEDGLRFSLWKFLIIFEGEGPRAKYYPSEEIAPGNPYVDQDPAVGFPRVYFDRFAFAKVGNPSVNDAVVDEGGRSAGSAGGASGCH